MGTTAIHFIASLCLAFGLVGISGGQHARAGDSGSFEFIRFFQSDVKTLDIGDGNAVSAGSHEGVAKITKSDGGPFSTGQVFTHEGVAYVKRSQDAIEIEAFLVHTDSESKDTYVTRAYRKSPKLERGSSTQEIISGTGKYAGMTGACKYSIEYLPDAKGIVTGHCDWELP